MASLANLLLMNPSRQRQDTLDVANLKVDTQAVVNLILDTLANLIVDTFTGCTGQF